MQAEHLRSLGETKKWNPSSGGSAGKACARAARAHSIEEAAANGSGKAVGSLFGDFTKFYECIRHDKLAMEAAETCFPLEHLANLLEVHSGWRMLEVDGVAGKMFHANCSIIAGTSGATTMAKVLLVRGLRKTSAAFLSSTLWNVVDDICACSSHESLNVVAINIAGIGKSFASLAAELDLDLHNTKTMWQASSSELVSRI